jgi:hypothetical protein
VELQSIHALLYDGERGDGFPEAHVDPESRLGVSQSMFDCLMLVPV